MDTETLKMKIAILNIYQNSVFRGAETYVDQLAKRLSKKHEVHLIVGNNKVQNRWPFLWRFYLDPQGLTIAKFTLKNIGKIWKEKYDCVIPTNGGWQPAIIRIITWLYGGKMIISGQSGMGWDDRNNLWSFPDVFIALSNKAKNWAKKVNPFVRVEKIPNGVDIKVFKPSGRKYKVDLPRPIVLCVGALTKTKRIDLAIKAVAGLKKSSLLIAAGGGDMKEEYSKLAKDLLGDRCKIIKVPHNEMPKVYRACDIFTLVSEPYYSFEIVLTEAMATGLPVVANRDDIRREIVGDSGVLVNPTDIKAYSLALETAMKLKWGKKPIRQAKKFDWDIIAQKYEKLFASLS